MKKLLWFGYEWLVHPITKSVAPVKPVSWGVAIGVFIGLTPTLGIQMYIVAALWALCRYLFHFRFSLPAGMASVWISNPITIVPFYYAFLLTGNKIFQNMQWHVVVMDWQTFQQRFADYEQYSIWEILWEGSQFLLVDLGIPMLVGSFILAVPSAVIFYFITSFLLTRYRKHKTHKAKISYEEWSRPSKPPIKSMQITQEQSRTTGKSVLRQTQKLISEGRYKQAISQLELLAKQNPNESAEGYYRLGNRLYDHRDNEQAEQAWQRSTILKIPPASHTSSRSLHTLLWRTVGTTMLILISLYCLIVLLFPRQFDLSEMLLTSIQQQQRESREASSWWERFWMTGRPSAQQYALEQGELWSILNRQMREFLDLFSSGKQGLVTVEDHWIEILNRLRYPRISNQIIQGKSQYYYLVGRGMHNLRRHSEALEALQSGLRETQDPQELGLLYQEIATIYYFEGYKLQPDGLAKYDKVLVRKSVDAYLQALQYIEDPFIYGNLGWGYYLLEDYEQAVYYGEKALQLDARLSYVRMNMGITYLRMNDYQNAFDAYEGLLQYHPNSVDYLGGLRDLEELSRDFPERHPFVHFIIGYIYYHQENFFKARQAWKIFLNQPFPENSWKQKTLRFLKSMERY